MREILFASDLDNTLLFSHRYRCDTDQCVEHLDGKEQGFCTRRSLDLLARICRKMRFIPVTTRSMAQYQRIEWPGPCAPRYAVTTNGGILLTDGKIDPEWYEQTKRLVAPWQDELLRMQSRLPKASVLRRYRMVDGLYLFAACDDEQSAEAGSRFFEGETTLDIAVSGRKVYFFPPPVNKGAAVARLKARFTPEKTICAGDSRIDIPMLQAADIAIIPQAEILREDGGAVLRVHSGAERFPDFVLESVLQEVW